MIVYQVQSQDITQTKNKIYDTFLTLDEAEKCLDKVKNDYETYVHNTFKVATQLLETQRSALTAERELNKIVINREAIDSLSVEIKAINEKVMALEYLAKNAKHELTFSINQIEVKE